MGLINVGKSVVRDSLILELDAANQKSWGAGNTWKDISSQGNDGTLTNGLTHSQGPFPGAGYVDFDGSGDTINVTHNNTLAGDFTVECWVRLNTSGIMMVGSSGYDYNTQWMRFNQNSTGNISSYMDGSGYFFQDVAGGITANKWHHVAICRSGTNTRLFVDGDLKETNTSFTGAPRFDKIGALYVNGILHTNDPNYFNGSISNVRVLDGTGLYTSNFTPPKSPLENISNTTLLTCQGSSITDASDNSSSITLVGNTNAVYNDVSYFDFDASNDHVSHSNDSFVSNGGATLECWFNIDTLSADRALINHSGFTYFNLLRTSNNKLRLEYKSTSGNNTQLFTTSTISAGSWYHVVAVVDNTGARIYLNGQLDASNTTPQNLGTVSSTLYVGSYSTSQYFFDGKIAMVKRYDKPLTVAEVTQNFNALRARYGV